MHVGCLQGLLSGMLVCQCCLQQCQLLMQSCRLSLLAVLLCCAADYTANLFTKSPAVSVLHTCTMACKSPQRAVGHRNFPLNASYTQECLLDVSNMS